MSSRQINHEQLLQALEILGIPTEALSVEIGGRVDAFPGVNSSWQLKYTIPGRDPYRLTTFYVPVLLPNDEAHLAQLTELNVRIQAAEAAGLNVVALYQQRMELLRS